MIVVGHRGARELWPENSLSGFRRLIASGATAVEFDVQTTRDGVPVVIHDPTLERTTEGNGAVCALGAAEVLATPLRAGQGLQGGEPGECVPALDAVLALLRPTPLELHVEIKTDALGELAPGVVPRLVRALHEAGMAERSILTCFVPEVLDQVLAHWPQARVLASLDHRAAEMLGGLGCALRRYAAMPGCIVAVHKALLATAWAPCLEALGPERLGVWVINEPDEIAYWIRQPLRQITSDRPDRVLAALNRPRDSA